MKNEFYVTACRFHVKDRNKLLIQGWFQENDFGDNALAVYLDQAELKYEIQYLTDVVEAKLCLDGKAEVKNRYYLWIELPLNWRAGHEISLINQLGDQKKKTFSN